MFTKVSLNNFIFIMDIFGTGPTKKFGIIGITTRHQASFCLPHTQQLWCMHGAIIQAGTTC